MQATTEPESFRPVFIHHEHLDSFRESLCAGCHLCNLINIQFSIPDPLDKDYDSRHAQCLIRWQHDSKRLYFSKIQLSEVDSPSPEIVRAATFDVVPAKGGLFLIGKHESSNYADRA